MNWELSRVVRDAIADSARAENLSELRAQLRAEGDGALRRFRLLSGAYARERSTVTPERVRRYARSFASGSTGA